MLFICWGHLHYFKGLECPPISPLRLHQNVNIANKNFYRVLFFIINGKAVGLSLSIIMGKAVSLSLNIINGKAVSLSLSIINGKAVRFCISLTIINCLATFCFMFLQVLMWIYFFLSKTFFFFQILLKSRLTYYLL